jgi:DNA-binding GntR family transcriptional regulator
MPLHAQLASALRAHISSRQLPVGTPLPGEVELAAELGVSRHTVRHALGALVNEGRLVRQKGARTTVAPEPNEDRVIERRLGNFYAFAWEIEARGERHGSQLLSRETLVADARLAHLLAVKLATPLERIERLRSANAEPLTLEVSVLPAALTSDFDNDALETRSLYDLLEEQHDIHITRAAESLRPVMLDDRAAELLRVPGGSPAFLVERVSWSAEGPVEWQQSLIRGDRYLYSVELPGPLTSP